MNIPWKFHALIRSVNVLPLSHPTTIRWCRSFTCCHITSSIFSCQTSVRNIFVLNNWLWRSWNLPHTCMLILLYDSCDFYHRFRMLPLPLPVPYTNMSNICKLADRSSSSLTLCPVDFYISWDLNWTLLGTHGMFLQKRPLNCSIGPKWCKNPRGG